MDKLYSLGENTEIENNSNSSAYLNIFIALKESIIRH
jgi:hypothetical protein